MVDLYIVRDLQNRLANMIRRGRVHSVDFENVPPLVKVEYAKDTVTGWLPWISGRASDQVVEWEPVSIGEEVIILSESGELSLGVVLPSLPNNTHVVPSTSPDEHVTKYSDGTEIKYHRQEHKLTITIGENGNAELNCNTFFINGNIQHDGDQTTTGNMTIEKSADIIENVTAGQNISAGQEVSDSVRSMAGDREIYNTHTHNHGDPTVPKPNESQ